MSITAALRDPESFVRQFMSEQFPNTHSVVRAANLKLKNVGTIRPAEPVGWGTVGAAADQRVQFYLVLNQATSCGRDRCSS